MSRLDWQRAASPTSIDESGTDYLYWVESTHSLQVEADWSVFISIRTNVPLDGQLLPYVLLRQRPTIGVETWERRGCSFTTPVNDMNAPDAADARGSGWLRRWPASRLLENLGPAGCTGIASYASAARF
jgi:hypothetical protein